MTWLSDLLPVFLIAFAVAMAVRWPLPRLLALGFTFGVLHWLGIGLLFGYRERGGSAALAFVLVVASHAAAWTLGVLVGRRVTPRSADPTAWSPTARPARGGARQAR